MIPCSICIGLRPEVEFWIEKLRPALELTEDARGLGKTTLTSFFKRICPKARAF